MRRKLWIAALALCLWGCGNAELNMSETESDVSENHTNSELLRETESDDELTLMQKVLFNKAEFYGNIDPYEEDGVIYGYCEPYRGLLQVCTDGTFIGSSGASDNDLLGNVQFDKHKIYYDTITSTTLDLSREEYVEIMSHYQKERNEEYWLTTENILKYIK